METKIYRRWDLTVFKLNENEFPEKLDVTMMRVEFIKELYRICDELSLDFRDFKNALLDTGQFKEVKSFERILNNGLPEKYIKNLEILNRLLDNIELALQNCANGTNTLKYSDFKTVKEKYEYHIESKGKFRNKLHYMVVMAIRADPELSKKEEEDFQLVQQYKAAKFFWDGVEGDEFEKIDHDCYKIPIVLCQGLFSVLKSDPVIMKRLQAKFDKKEYWPFD